ncbi:MAG TPA: tetratricopeptide repeat protein [Hyphomonadaceae bacterium]|jgi:Flp pilus assembly protein TadD
MPALRTATAIAAAALLSGCLTAPPPTPQEVAMVDTAQKSLLPATAAEREAANRQDLLSQAKFWGAEYEKNPNEYEAALRYANVLRAIGSSPRASEVAGQALTLKQADLELTLVYAQAALDQGKAEDAATALARAEKEGQNDWRMLSIIGVTMDSLDQHKAAQDYYKRALALAPDNPKILSNLGLSYALEGKPGMAEETLRRALTHPEADARVKLNLMLVLGVQGKFDEAEKIAGPETPKALIESNKEYFRTLLSPSRTWDQLRGSQN